MWVVRKRDKNKIKKYFYHFLGTTILISFIISSFVGAQWAFGPSQSWCWIGTTFTTTITSTTTTTTTIR